MFSVQGLACLGACVLGLLFLSASVNSERFPQVSLERALADCVGGASVSGVVKNVFYARSGFVEVLSQNKSNLFVFSRGERFEKGKVLSVEGRLERFKGECWLFAKQARVLA